MTYLSGNWDRNEQYLVFIATPFYDSLDDIAEAIFRGSYSEITGLANAVSLNLEGKCTGVQKGE